MCRAGQTSAQHHPVASTWAHATIQGACRSEPRTRAHSHPCPGQKLGHHGAPPRQRTARCNACQLDVMRCSYSRSCERDCERDGLAARSNNAPLCQSQNSARRCARRGQRLVQGCCFAAHALRATLLLWYILHSMYVQDYSHAGPWLPRFAKYSLGSRYREYCVHSTVLNCLFLISSTCDGESQANGIFLTDNGTPVLDNGGRHVCI